MNRFNKLPEFEKEFSKLSKKYRSLPEDLMKLEKLIELNPVGFGTNFVTIHNSDKAKVVKARLACKSLRDRSIRIIYAYHQDTLTFMHIEMYFKGDKANENRERINEYVKTISYLQNMQDNCLDKK
jgi:mRNA-degrading endonuclease RelE of RelBE toxin-antitoxin system